MSEINTHKISVLAALFQDNKVFEVPHYQRSYTWEEDLIQELWTDILNSADKGFQSLETHYLIFY